jgi:hypothetical protein
VRTIAPRPLRDDESPEPGDVFFERGYRMLSILIRVFTGSDINHTGVVVATTDEPGVWVVAEANSPGFEMTTKANPDAYLVRISDSAEDRRALVDAATMMAAARYRYDFLAILRLALIILARLRPGTLVGKVLLGLPTLLLRAVSRGVLRVLPHEPAHRVICSGAVRRLLRETFGEGDWASSLPARDDETSPAALMRGLYGRRRW